MLAGGARALPLLLLVLKLDLRLLGAAVVETSGIVCPGKGEVEKALEEAESSVMAARP